MIRTCAEGLPAVLQLEKVRVACVLYHNGMLSMACHDLSIQSALGVER